jgi:hypothetical protein
LLYLLFSKFVPIISIWELKAGEKPDLKSSVAVEDTETAGELV